MNTESTILIKAPLDDIFALTSDLERWPAYLPHYRYVTFLEREPTGGVIAMGAKRGIIPISWVSKLHVDREGRQVHFHHLKAFTKGMVVVWHYRPEGDAVRVTIVHVLHFRIPWLAWLAEPIIGNFIHAVAGKTLATFKQRLENQAGAAS